VARFHKEPLLLPALSDGAQPRPISIRMAQTVLRALVANLPRVGLLRETHRSLENGPHHGAGRNRPAAGA